MKKKEEEKNSSVFFYLLQFDWNFQFEIKVLMKKLAKVIGFIKIVVKNRVKIVVKLLKLNKQTEFLWQIKLKN